MMKEVFSKINNERFLNATKVAVDLEQSFDWRFDADRNAYTAPLDMGDAYRVHVALEGGFNANGLTYTKDGDVIVRTATDYECDGVDIYTPVSERYDAEFSGEADTQRRKDRFGALDLEGATGILDVGCGTGNLTRFRNDSFVPGSYVGIDPSIGMIARFRRHRPEYESRILCCSFEDYWPHKGRVNLMGCGLYTHIVAMAGTASYMGDPGFVSDKIKWLLLPGGRAYLMYYRESEEELLRCQETRMPRPEKYFDPVSGDGWVELHEQGPYYKTMTMVA